MENKILVIGGGVTGMEAASQLAGLGYAVTLFEKQSRLGGHVDNWHHLFPDKKPATELLMQLKTGLSNKVAIHFNADILKIIKNPTSFHVELTDGQQFSGDAILLATGYDLFDARRKEEYGYGIYDNVITSADLEKMLANGKVKTTLGKEPKRIAFIHCVGSRDEKSGNTYCSKVCCVTGVKQAMEVKALYPEVDVYNFYMDLRMFDRYFEDLYLEAQSKYGVQFIRGRLSEACDNPDGTIVLKAEDTLIGKPIRITVDMMVLLTGMVVSKETRTMSNMLSFPLDDDGFIKTTRLHNGTNLTLQDGVFCAGACSGPKTITESITDARSAALQIHQFITTSAIIHTKKIPNTILS